MKKDPTRVSRIKGILSHTLTLAVGSVAKRAKAPFLWRPCDHNRVI